MLSLKVFDRSNSHSELLEAYRHAAVLILESLTQHGPAGDESDYDSFRVIVAGVIEKLEAQHAKGADIHEAAGVASTAIQEYNRQTVSTVRARGVELQAVVACSLNAYPRSRRAASVPPHGFGTSSAVSPRARRSTKFETSDRKCRTA